MNNKTTYPDGTTEWSSSIGIRHKINEHSIQHPDGYKAWFVNNMPHRINGPAIHYANGNNSWYINGTNYSKSDYNRILKLSLVES